MIPPAGSFPRPPLVEPTPLARKGYRLREKQATCAWCKAKLRGRQRVCCGAALCRKMTQGPSRRARDREAGRPVRHYLDVRGLQCQACGAFDHETGFNTLAKCKECERQGHRAGKCENRLPPSGEVCGTIKARDTSGPYCPRCNPPRYAIEILWVNHADQRMRTLYRNMKDGRVSVRGKLYRVLTNPLRLVVPHEEWLPVRR